MLLSPFTDGPGHLGGQFIILRQVSVALGVNRRNQVDQKPVLQTDLGGWCCAHWVRQRAGTMGQPIRGGGDCRETE